MKYCFLGFHCINGIRALTNIILHPEGRILIRKCKMGGGGQGGKAGCNITLRSKFSVIFIAFLRKEKIWEGAGWVKNTTKNRCNIIFTPLKKSSGF